MKSLLPLLLFFVSFSCVAEMNEAELVQNLMAICREHPDFRASSIDFFEEKTAQAFEKSFYQIARKLHSKGSSQLLLQMRKNAKTKEEINCIDNIFNTWPG